MTNSPVRCSGIATQRWLGRDLNDATIIGGCNERWIINQAHDINNTGSIACWAYKINGNAFHALVLVPLNESCPPDIDNSGSVDVDDLLAVINGWGPCPQSAFCTADVTYDCVVDTDDLLLVINSWGAGCQSGTGDAPNDVDSCYERTRDRYPETGSQAFADAFDACIESLCRRGLLIGCD